MTSDFNAEGMRDSDQAFLTGAVAERFPQVDTNPALGLEKPGFDGTFDDFVAKFPEKGHQLYNQVKICPNAECKKICAKVMMSCNGCNADISGVEVSKSPNLFIAFIFGVREGRFPFKLSLRYEMEDVMIFDDPLALSRCHILAVPTKVFCPDIRYLFTNPAAGIELLIKLEATAWLSLRSKVTGSAPLNPSIPASATWMEKSLSQQSRELLKDGAQPAGEARLRDCVLGAFNLPPSQYQLHLQYILPPMLPFHTDIYNKKQHFKEGRHFPLRYVVQGLLAFQDAGKTLEDPESYSAEAFIEEIDKLGLSYKQAWQHDMDRYEKNQKFLAKFTKEDFKYYVKGSDIYDVQTNEVSKGEETLDSLKKHDKLALQGYGRPYENGNPGGRYYKHFLPPSEELPTFGKDTQIKPFVLPAGEEEATKA